MANPFEVITDNSGRIISYVPDGHPGTQIAPEDIAEGIDGGERLVLGDAEYELTASGSLVHPGVEVHDAVRIGTGVRVDEGTVFHHDPLAESGDAPNNIVVGNRARIRGTELYSGVEIGSFALILARSIGSNSVIGSYARVGEGVSVGSSVQVGNAVKVDRDTLVRSGVVIGRAARIGYKTTIGIGAKVGHHARVGSFTGEGPRGVNQDGPFIANGRVIEPKERVR